jgi:hypothetical protein
LRQSRRASEEQLPAAAGGPGGLGGTAPAALAALRVLVTRWAVHDAG